MGIILSSLTDTRPDVADPVTTLTPKQKDMVISSFKVLRKDATATGETLFLLLFKKHPEYQQYFRDLQHIPYDGLKGNSKLLSHGLTVASALATLVDNLDNVGILVKLLAKLGKSHRRRGISEKAFNDLNICILELLKKKLGRRLSKACLEAWTQLLSVVFSTICKALNGEIEAEDDDY